MTTATRLTSRTLHNKRKSWICNSGGIPAAKTYLNRGGKRTHHHRIHTWKIRLKTQQRPHTHTYTTRPGHEPCGLHMHQGKNGLLLSSRLKSLTIIKLAMEIRARTRTCMRARTHAHTHTRVHAHGVSMAENVHVRCCGQRERISGKVQQIGMVE